LDEFGSAKDCEAFYRNLSLKKRQGLEEFLLRDYSYPPTRYLDLIGTKYLRQDDLTSALLWYQKVPEDFWQKRFFYNEYLKNNPFTYHGNREIWENHRVPKILKDLLAQEGGAFVDKAYFVEQVIALKRQLKKAKQKDKSALETALGYAYFNISYFGQNWHYISYAHTHDRQHLPSTRHDLKIDQNYYTCNTAFKYFKDAYKHAKNTDAASDILFYAGAIQIRANDYQYMKNNFFTSEITTKYADKYHWLDECPGWFEQ
jgi:hypothetical protein